jgi:hypothetical protein
VQIAENKSKEEDLLIQTIDMFHTDIPRMVRLCDFQPSTDVASTILQFYTTMIELARDAIKYFGRHSGGE